MAKTQKTTKKKTPSEGTEAPQKAPAKKAPKVRTYTKSELLEYAEITAPKVVTRWLEKHLK